MPSGGSAVRVAAVECSSDALEVSWPAVPGATGYVVAWKTAGGAYSAVASSETAVTSGRITALEAETAYTVRVTARHTIAGSTADGDSAEGSATTNAPPANTPVSGAPTISGTAQVGETLTAATSGISDADGLDNAKLRLPVAGRRVGHIGSHRLQLYAGDWRCGRGHQCAGVLQRRRRQRRVPDQRRHGGGSGGGPAGFNPPPSPSSSTTTPTTGTLRWTAATKRSSC